MARVRLQWFVNPETGQRDLFVDYFSEEDMLPFEHEQEHRSLVDRLFEGGTFQAAEHRRVVVERAEDPMPVLVGG